MKKIIYAIVLGLVVGLSFSACTEEPIKPSNVADSGAGYATEIIKR